MASIRQEKIAGVIQKELSLIFQKEARTICMGAMVSVTIVRISPDMGNAKIYLSVFGAKENEEVLINVQDNGRQVRHMLAQAVKNHLRKPPELTFFLDDAYDYARNIDELLK